MTKGKRRKLVAAEKARRRASQYAPGNKSKYARKIAAQMRGQYNPGSPFKYQEIQP